MIFKKYIVKFIKIDITVIRKEFIFTKVQIYVEMCTLLNSICFSACYSRAGFLKFKHPEFCPNLTG